MTELNAHAIAIAYANGGAAVTLTPRMSQALLHYAANPDYQVVAICMGITKGRAGAYVREAVTIAGRRFNDHPEQLKQLWMDFAKAVSR